MSGMVEKIVAAIDAELKRQASEEGLYYVPGEHYTAVDGDPDLKAIATAILPAIRESVKQIVMDAEPYAGPYVHDICRDIDAAFDEAGE